MKHLDTEAKTKKRKMKPSYSATRTQYYIKRVFVSCDIDIDKEK